MKRFEEFNLNIDIIQGIRKMGYEKATKIQTEAIPLILDHQDIIGLAQTGTGKTLAFASTMLSMLEYNFDKTIKGVVLSPTRELVVQIENEMRRIGAFTKAKITSVYGGSKIEPQIRDIKRGTDIIIATPGRLMDLMRRKVVKLDHVSMFVLDEADEMLNMGFLEDIETILSQTNPDRQTVLFSATMRKEIEHIAKQYMREDAITLKVDQHIKTATTIKQYYIETKPSARLETLCRLIDYAQIESGIIFCKTKKSVDDLAFALKNRHYQIEAIHGDLTQEQRLKSLRQFKEGTTTLLVATDVVARGIDIENVTHVINYELPQEKEAYVHRIGRTGRASREGTSYTIITSRERSFIDAVQKQMHCTIKPLPIPTNEQILEVKGNALFTKASAYYEQNKHQRFVDIMKEYDYRTLVDLSASLFAMLYEKEIGFDESKQVQHVDQYDVIRLNVGKKERIQAKQALFFICDYAHVPRKAIGHIHVMPKYIEVQVEKKYTKDVLERCMNQRLNRHKVKVSLA